MSDDADPFEDARMEELEAIPVEPRKKRSKGTSPTARTLEECRRRGWIAGVVERHSPFPKPFGKKHDFLGVIDLIAIVPGAAEHDASREVIAAARAWCRPDAGGSEHDRLHDVVRALELLATGDPGATIGIQACSDGRTGSGGRGSDLAARRDKILAEPRARAWVEAGNRLEIWAWGSRVVGKGKRWRVRVERFEVRDGKLVGIEDSQ